MSKTSMVWLRLASWALGSACALFLSACGSAPSGYGVAAESRAAAASAAAADEPAPNTQATYLALVRQMQRNGLWFASLAHIDALEQQYGPSPETQLMRADALRQTGQAPAAERAYKALLKTPVEASGYRGLGLLAAARGSYQDAVEMFGQAQRRTPTDGLLLNDLAYAYIRAGRVADARLPMMQAAQLVPDSLKVQSNLALYLLLSGDEIQARRLMQDRKMSPQARDAIEQEALSMPGTATAAQAKPPVPAVGSDAAVASLPPLALKASTWRLSTPAEAAHDASAQP